MVLTLRRICSLICPQALFAGQVALLNTEMHYPALIIIILYYISEMRPVAESVIFYLTVEDTDISN